MVKISGVIITFNEEANIIRCIDSLLPVVDEIVVVDSYSTDRTKELCLGKGVRFVEHPFRTHIDQKNVAMKEARYPYILSLDADEYLSEELTKSIKKVRLTKPAEAFRMNRLSSYGGKWIKHGSWYPDKKIRLWNRELGSWGGENPHDRVILQKGTKVVHLNGDILHRAYKDAKETLEKVQRYSQIFAKEGLEQKASSVPIIFFHTFFAFWKSYIVKRGIQDGFEGMMVAMAEANHVFYKYAKLYEANKRQAIGKRVIISRTDNLGDVILTLPLVGFLKRIRPGIEIYFIGKRYTHSILDNCIHVDQFLDREEILENPEILRAVKADTIFFIYPDRKLAQLASKIRIRRRIGTGHRWFNWVYCNYRIDFSRIRSRAHESQLNFKLLSPFNIYWDLDLGEMTNLYGLVPSRKLPVEYLSNAHFNLILHPKSKGSAREWALENYYQLAKSLPEDRYRIFITGLKEEGEAIRREMPVLFNLEHVTDMTGRLDLDELISFISQSDCLVACSTGVLHLAASLGKPCIGLYSPMRPIHPGRWRPIGEQATYLVIDKKCNDCRETKVCKCVNEITPNQVKQSIEAHSAVALTRRYAEI